MTVVAFRPLATCK